MGSQLSFLYNQIKARKISQEDAVKYIKELKAQLNQGITPAFSMGNEFNIVPEVYVYDEPYLRDHTVYNKQVLIGVTHSSLAISSFFAIFPQENSVRLHRLSFVKPIEVEKDQRVEVLVEPVHKGDTIDFRVVYRFASSAAWNLTATGILQKAVFESQKIDINSVKDSLEEFQQPEVIYTLNPAVEMGDSFKVITQLYTGKDQVLARVAIGQDLLNNHGYVLNPLIINSAFLAVGPLVEQVISESGFLPFGIRDIRFRKTNKLEQSWLLVRLVKNSGEMIVFDADVIDDESQVIANFSGCSMKRLRSADQITAKDSLFSFSAKPLQQGQEYSDLDFGASVSAADLSSRIEKYLINKLGKIVPDRSRLSNLEVNLMDLGMESSQLVAMANEIESETNIKLYPTLFFEYPNIKELKDYFSKEHQDSFIQLLGKAAAKTGVSVASHQALETISAKAVQEGFQSNHAALQAPAQKNTFSFTETTKDDIAIIGMHGLFAGASDLNQLWNNLVEKRDLIKEIPIDHWDFRPWYDENPKAKNKTYCKWGSFIDDVDKFDAGFFNISPREAEWMDPQLRLLLQSIYATGEDAGYINQLRGTNTGVFVGVCFHDYMDRIAEMSLPVDPYVGTGNVQTVIANRVSFLFDFTGPSFAVDTACSSSLFALHYACNALRNRECDMAFVGGVNLLLSSWHYRYFCSIGALSPTGRCHTFDEAADGYVPGECVASILLKPLQQAKRDNDRIYAVIKGSAALHGGYTPSLTSPSVAGEENVILKAWENAGIDAENLSYIEAHGTGTKLGDPLEINSLKKSFQRFTSKEHFCAIGSIKSNIGHTEGAAGIAGLLKVILQMKHRQIPAMPQFKRLNHYIHLDKSALYINTEVEEWKSPAGVPRRAGVSSFGFAGAYSHVVLEEYIPMAQGQPPISISSHNPAIIVLSAKNENRLQEQAQRLLAAIREQKFSNANLADMAYTLQVGREAMEERLAMIVGSIKEIEEKLKGFLDGLDDIEGMYREKIKRNKETLAIFEADEDLQRGIDAWITKRKYTKLLELWVKGVTIEWNKLYGDIKPCRISLPTYSFAKERYWVPESGIRPSGSTVVSSSIHPLLHQNTSDFSKQQFSSTFTGQEFFLADHVVMGQRVLPGVAYLEMVLAAVAQAAGAIEEGKAGIRLKNVVWSRPIIVGDQPVRVHIGLFPEDNGEIAYEIYNGSEAVDMEPKVLSQGSAALCQVVDVPTLDLKALQAQCSQITLSSAQCYEAFKSMGIDYGPAHQGVEKVYVGSGQVLAKLSLPSSISGTQEQFILHPSMVDAALQASIGLIPGNTMLPGGEAPLKPALPFALHELELFGKCTPQMWAFIQYSGGSKAEDKLRKLDIDLCDDQGNLCLRMRGFSSRVLEGEVGSVGPSAALGTLILHPCWKEQATVQEVPTSDYAQHLVMLCEPGEVHPESIETHMKGVRCIVLQSGHKEIEDRYHAYASQVFEKIQSILKNKPKGMVLIQIVIFTREEQQLFAGLFGLLKTAGLENPKLIGQLIEVEPTEYSQSIIEKLKENSRSPIDTQIRYQEGKRLIAGWSEVDTSQEAVGILWKDQGVYLITGGTGGLGFIFAREIAHKVKGVTLILTGRSPLNGDKQVQVKELEKLGARTEYRQVDVAQKKAVAYLIQSIQEDFGSLHGIIHSAGVIRDNLIIKKTSEELQEVLVPKVRGLVNLDQASRDVNLDFFILFSSIAGTIGNPGQADYASANAFMDVFASYRNALVASKQRYGQTLSINWPLWKDGGMRVDEETENMIRKNKGIVAIETSTGIRFLYQGLASRKDQVMVLEGDLKRLKAILLGQPSGAEASNSPSYIEENKPVPAIAQDLVWENAINYFKMLFSSVIKLPAQRIEADAPMEKYGIDSFMVVKMTNQLEKTFGSLSKTLFFEYQNIQELAGYFLESHRDQLIGLLGIEEKAGATTPDFKDSAVMSQPERPAPGSSGRLRFASYHIEPREEKRALDIAIIGVAGRYPQARNIQEFWGNLQEGKDCITVIPKDRWDYRMYFDQDKNKSGKTCCKWGGFIDGVDQFDPLFFNISPREAEIMDPQERLFLECVFETLEDAGYTRESLGGHQGFGLERNVGVYVGVMYEEYQLYGAQEQIQGRPIALTGLPASIANRVSYFCNFHGPSMAVNTMCSSSLTAVHLACQSLQRGECELAVAGGVNVSIHPNKYLFLSQGNFVSSKGRCESFGQGGDGYVPGEGVGAVLLKPLKKAIADRDNIYGIIKATAINHGGKTNGYTVPNPNAQASVIGRIFKEAGINPRTISYIEAHGTGTSLGDPIEIAGLNKTFQEYTRDKQFCTIGSVKSNIGHCESAAGVAGLTKVLLQLKYRQLVPSLHSSALNPNIDFSITPFVVQQELAEWKRPVVEIKGEIREYPRIAGISSFGAGGSNAHVVIEEYISKDLKGPRILSTPQDSAIIVLSAKNEDRLKEQARRLLAVIQKEEFSDASLADMAYTLQVGREAMEERLAVIVKSVRELEEKLKGFVEGKEIIADFYRGQIKRHKETLAVFAVDEDMAKTIDAWIAKGKYAKLLDLWVKGLIFDWNKLYPGANTRRISLPTYPFAREHYWYPRVEAESASSTPSPAITDLTNPRDVEKIIIIKEWKKKPLKAEADIQKGVVVVLGTLTTTKLAFALFEDMEAIHILQAIHGETQLPESISTDFYSASAGEYLYQKIKEKLNGQKLLGVIDITAYDKDYEESTAVESGKIVFLQKLIEHDRNEGYKLLQVTHQLHAFQLDKTTIQGARLAGLYRMLSAEYKQIQAMTVDSDCLIQDQKKIAKQIETEFFNINKGSLTECCYRNDKRYEPQLTISHTNEDIKKILHVKEKYEKHDVVLITGGSRGIGASIAEHVVSHGVKNLIIMGREGLPKQSEWKNILKNKEKSGIYEKIRRMQILIDQGVRVHYYNTSLTDQEGISLMVQKIHQDLGPITGVFHCAGLTSRNPAFYKKPLQDIEAVCEPKMKGLVTLHKALEKEPITFFILFSSISSIAPTLSVGQSDYALANAYMDYYAQHQATQGNSYFKSIQWPAWGETGMAAGGMRTSSYIKTGIISHTTKDGLEFLDIIKMTPNSVSLPCVVVPFEFTCEQLLITEIVPIKKEPILTLQKTPKLKQEILPARISQVDLRTSIYQWLEKVFESELKLKADQFDANKPFDEYGVDSVIVAQLVQTIQEKVSKTIAPSLLLEYSTIAALTDYFMVNHAEAFQNNLLIEASSVAEEYLEEDSFSTNKDSSQLVNAEIGYNSKPISVSQSIGDNVPVQSAEDIAVIGLSCRLPGSPTKEAYWNLLTKGVSAIKPLFVKRWISKENPVYYGGWVDDFDLFDSSFFNINENDAAVMDPQARIILEESLQAIYDAGYEHKKLSGEKIGVYIGGRSQLNMNVKAVFKAPNPILGIGQNYMATNISRFFNFKGPSLVVDTACSSGITGMLLATESLQGKRIDMALVGAVNILLSPFAHDLFAARNILSKNGQFHIFDIQSNGEVLGEGAGVVILKRLSDAIKDGNHIYGVIKAISVNNDGRTLGPGSPNINAQKQVIQDALTISGKQPEDIGYIEVNGGGSPVIDSIEIKALSEAYNLSNQTLTSCFVGSVKPNIGHLLLASGLAGFIRCVLSVYHKQIPPFLSAIEPFRYYDFSASRINFNRETIHWKVDIRKKRIAAQNSFPDGGTNCHVLLEEFVADGSYQQRYYPMIAPEMVKKYFPVPQLSFLESYGAEEQKRKGIYDFKEFKNKPDREVEQQHNSIIKNIWGRYDEKNI